MDMADAVQVNNLNDLPDEFFDNIDVVALDEAQFLHPLVEFCEKHANAGRVVIVAALDGDANRNPFGEVCDLIPKAERVDKLSSVCMVCRTADAAFTKRLVDSKAVEVIGGIGMYEARCRGCWDEPCNPTVATTSTEITSSKEEEVQTKLEEHNNSSPPKKPSRKRGRVQEEIVSCDIKTPKKVRFSKKVPLSPFECEFDFE
jgi:thymidine kinase